MILKTLEDIDYKFIVGIPIDESVKNAIKQEVIKWIKWLMELKECLTIENDEMKNVDKAHEMLKEFGYRDSEFPCSDFWYSADSVAFAIRVLMKQNNITEEELK